jgi:hypothetical protein
MGKVGKDENEGRAESTVVEEKTKRKERMERGKNGKE